MYKRVLSFLLALCMIVSLSPVMTLAAETEIPAPVSAIYINPMYADVMTEEELAEPSQWAVMPLADVTYHTDAAAAGEEIRRPLVERTETIVLGYQIPDAEFTNEGIGAIGRSIFAAAVAHTGNPVEGDYVERQYGGYRISAQGDSYNSASDSWNSTVTFTVTYYTTYEQEGQMDEAVAELTEELDLNNASRSDYEKLELIYDWMCDNITYDYDNLGNESYKLQYTAYAALINRTAVCQGYANLLYRLALHTGIDCRIITGVQTSSGGGHAWNIVRLGNKYYNADATWDINYKTNDNYQYFLRADSTFADHTRDEAFATESFYASYPMDTADFDPSNSGGTSSAIAGTCGDDLEWYLEDGVLTISGTGAMYDFNDEAPWAEYLGQFTKVVVEEGVTTIGRAAFSNYWVEEVELPEGLISIGNDAFFNCNFTSLDLPDTLTTIGEWAFYYCCELNGTVEIPASVTEIGELAFGECPQIEAFQVDSGNANYASVDGVLYDKSITMLIQYPGGSDAVSYETPDTLTAIGPCALGIGGALQTVTISAGVEDISDGALSGNTSLIHIYVDDANACFKDEDGVLFSKDGLAILAFPAGRITGDGSYTIPEGVQLITAETFRHSSLTKVTLPSTVKTLSNLAFTYMNSLKEIDLAVVEEIENHAFQGCNRIGTMTFPATVSKIGGYLFGGVSGPDTIIFLGEAPALGMETQWSAPFQDVTSTAYYPANLDGWTEEMMTAYGGDITWIPYEGEVPDVPETPEEGTETEGNYGGVHWYLEDGLLTLSGAADMEDQADAYGYPWYEFRNEIQRIFIYEVTSVGDHAFEDYPNLEYFMTDSATSIGAYAFAGTTAMTDCNLSENLASIGAYAFSGSSIHSVYFHSDAPIIDETAFTGVTADAYYSSATSGWTEDVLQNYGGTLTWYEQVEVMGGGSIEDGYWEVSMDGHLEVYNWSSDAPVMPSYGSIEEYPWGELADRITSVYVGGNWTNVGAYAFADCYYLESVVVGPSVTSVGAYAFGNNGNLTEVQFTGDAPVIDETAFTDVTADVLYYSTASGWDDSVKQNYGGSLTWSVINIGGEEPDDSETEGTCGENLTWKVENGILTISGTGDMTDYISDSYPWYAFRDEIVTVVIEEGVASIGNCVFWNCSALKEVIIPDTVTSIGTGTFCMCMNLTDINLPDSIVSIGESAFDSCTSLKEIVIPAGVSVISAASFWGCTGAQTVLIPEGVTTIGNSAFSSCGAAEIELPSTLTTIGSYAFQGADLTTVTVPSGVSSIGEGAFSYCESLSEVTFTGDAPEMGENVFAEMTLTVYYPAGNDTWTADKMGTYGGNITWEEIPDDGIIDGTWGDNLTWSYNAETATLTISGEGAMEVASYSDEYEAMDYPWLPYMTQMQELIIEEGVTSISEGAFRESTISRVTLPEGLLKIGTAAFAESHITGVSIPDSVTSISMSAFGECPYLNEAKLPAGMVFAAEGVFAGCKSLTTVIMPRMPDYELNSLSMYAMFEDCDALTNIDFVTFPAITECMFAWCDGLEEITIPASVESVWMDAFRECTNLHTVTFPASVEELKTVIFTDCGALDTLYFEGNAPGVDPEAVESYGAPLDGLTATAYYDAGNTTWTEEAKEALGGNITWVALCLEHVVVTDAAVAPTCTETGLTEGSHCSVCGKVLVAQEVIPATGHEFSAGAGADPTCTEDGYVEYVCFNCWDFSVSYREVIPATGHNLGDWYTVENPTCTEEGSCRRDCSKCDYFESGIIDALGHTAVTDPAVAPGCIDTGWTEGSHCEACGEILVAQEVIPATGHNFVIAAGTDPTCTKDGYVEYACCNCWDLSVSYREVVPATGHSYVDGVCEVCGHVNLAAPVVTGSNVASSGKNKLSWNAVEGAVSYNVYRSTSKTGNYTKLKNTTGTTFTNTGAKAGTTYYYYVEAVAADESVSEPSNIVTRTCDYARPVVKVTNVASSGKIKLTWDAVDGATSYKIYRSTSKNGTYSLIKTATSTSFTNTSVEAGTLYYYQVMAVGSKSAANSAKSSTVSRTCDLPRPTVTVTNVASSGKIKVTWEAVEGAVSYKVYRSTSSDGTYSLVKTTTGTSYTNTSAVAGTTYYYKVVAVHSKSAANSAYSSVKSRTCDLARPNVSIALKSGKPRLTWTAIEGAVSYKIYRSTSKDGTYSLIKTTTSTSYTNTGAKSGTTYYYKVIAVHSKSAANSAYSLIDSIKSK